MVPSIFSQSFPRRYGNGVTGGVKSGVIGLGKQTGTQPEGVVGTGYVSAGTRARVKPVGVLAVIFAGAAGACVF